jgi:arylsulfatase A-like enzyme
LGLSENTIVIFSSDNGPVLDDGYQDDAVIKIGKHTPNGSLRGGKYSLYDAGTHVPFMVRWKGTIDPGVSDALVCQIDFTASFAAMTKQENKTIDSENILDALLGISNYGRDNLVLGQNNITAFRQGDWVLIPPHQGPKIFGFVNIESGRDSIYQLYNIKDDEGQQDNLADKDPDKAKEMEKELERIKSKI